MLDENSETPIRNSHWTIGLDEVTKKKGRKRGALPMSKQRSGKLAQDEHDWRHDPCFTLLHVRFKQIWMNFGSMRVLFFGIKIHEAPGKGLAWPWKVHLHQCIGGNLVSQSGGGEKWRLKLVKISWLDSLFGLGKRFRKPRTAAGFVLETSPTDSTKKKEKERKKIASRPSDIARNNSTIARYARLESRRHHLEIWLWKTVAKASNSSRIRTQGMQNTSQ